MKLNVNIDGQEYPVEVPTDLLFGAQAIFKKMDQDLDAGWQMSREWVRDLNTIQRCQVVANRLLTAIETDNQASALMMAGYIVNKLPTVQGIYIDTEGDMTQTEIVLA